KVVRCCKVIEGLFRPGDDHAGRRLRTRGTFLFPQDSTIRFTSSCGTASPRSSDAIAFLIPSTCHSFTSRYSFSASDARKDRLRPVLFASLSSRFNTSASTRTVKVAEDTWPPYTRCVHVYKLARFPLSTRPRLPHTVTPLTHKTVLATPLPL